MKTLSLFILTLLIFYNPKVHALGLTSSYTEALSTFDILENQADIISINSEVPNKDMDVNLVNFNKLVKIFKYFQTQQTQLAERLLEKVQNHNTLTGDELYLLKRGFEVFYKMNSQMLRFGEMVEPKLNLMSRGFGRRNLNKRQVKSNLIWITAHLLTLDHIERIHHTLYEVDSSLRRILKNILKDNQLEAVTRKRIKELSEQINDVAHVGESEDFQNHIFLIQKLEGELKREFKDDSESLSLIKEIMSNETTKQILNGRHSFLISGFGVEDALTSLAEKLTNLLSGFFGNVAGTIKWRDGYFYHNEELEKKVNEGLKPMDILFEKSPFVVTDKFIPGHFGHVALYIGTKKQLEDLGMWGHPSIVPFQDQIEKGHTILEAVRPGVRLTSLSEFLNIDELTVVRKSDALDSPKKVSEQIARGFEQIGKSYDFNFDISTLDKIVCSELLYIVFGHVNWPTRYRFDRPTVTPDDLSEILFMKNTRFHIAQYLLSTKRHKLQAPSIEHLAVKLDYEKRTQDGLEITNLDDQNDLTNSYWKKETKCYTLTTPINEITRKCNTTYKEFYYEESGS